MTFVVVLQHVLLLWHLRLLDLFIFSYMLDAISIFENTCFINFLKLTLVHGNINRDYRERASKLKVVF